MQLCLFLLSLALLSLRSALSQGFFSAQRTGLFFLQAQPDPFAIVLPLSQALTIHFGRFQGGAWLLPDALLHFQCPCAFSPALFHPSSLFPHLLQKSRPFSGLLLPLVHQFQKGFFAHLLFLFQTDSNSGNKLALFSQAAGAQVLLFGLLADQLLPCTLLPGLYRLLILLNVFFSLLAIYRLPLTFHLPFQAHSTPCFSFPHRQKFLQLPQLASFSLRLASQQSAQYPPAKLYCSNQNQSLRLRADQQFLTLLLFYH